MRNPISREWLSASPFVERIALWIKGQAHAMRVLGGLFFVLALLVGIFWALGANTEPVAYIFGLVSSLLLASPSIAEFVIPDRKPVSRNVIRGDIEISLGDRCREGLEALLN